LHPDVRVPMREIELTPTKSFNGQIEANEPVRVYDCSGPWGDPNFKGNVEQGLPALRRDWILKRGDVEECEVKNPQSTVHSPQSTIGRKPLRAKSGKVVTQLAYARAGIITPEMEFIAIRENMRWYRRPACPPIRLESAIYRGTSSETTSTNNTQAVRSFRH